jgi:hypothetical protein
MLAFALLVPRTMLAQTSSMPDPDAATRAVCDEVEASIATQRLADAEALLTRERSARGISAESNHALAVLTRLVQRLRREAALPPVPIAITRSDARDGFEAAGLYATTIGYGLATGLWLDAQLGVTSLEAAAWIPLVGVGAGVAAGYLVDHPRAVRRGTPTTLGTGLALGLLGGASVGLQGWRNGDWSTATMATVTWAGATAGLGTAVMLTLLASPTQGGASITLSGGFWGGALGFLTAYAFDSERYYGSFTLIGEAVGVAAAVVGASLLRPSPSLARWVDLGALTGALVGGGVGFLFLRDERPLFAAALQATSSARVVLRRRGLARTQAPLR